MSRDTMPADAAPPAESIARGNLLLDEALQATAGTQDLLAQTVNDMLRQRLRDLGLDPDNLPAAGVQAPAARDPRSGDWDAEAQAAYMARPVLEVRLPDRFRSYVEQRAAAHGESPQRHVETIVRMFAATDPWKLQQTGTAPRDPGLPAGTGLRL